MAGLLLTMALVFLAIAARLVSIQGISAKHYVAVGLSQGLTTVSLPSQRGAIFDRTGDALADSVPQSTIYGDPQQVTDPREEATILSPLLGVPVATLQAQLTGRSQFVYLARKVDNALAAQVTKLNLPGIGSRPEPKRFYPDGLLAAPLLGTVGSENMGLSGLEGQYNRQLSGTPGKLVEERDPSGTPIPGGLRQYQPPVNGQDLVLTIDDALQAQAEQALAAQVIATKAQSGMAAVMDTQTGELLAVVSLTAQPLPTPAGAKGSPVKGSPAKGTCPTPVPVAASTTAAATAAAAAAATPAAVAAAGAVACPPGETSTASPFTTVFEPGSMSKLVTISAALQSGVVSPADRFSVPDTLPVADSVFHDAESHPVENWTVTDILANSSNVGTITLAQRLGASRLDAALAAFGFGRETAVQFPGESAGLVPALAQWSGTSIGTIAIGQGVAVTAIQMLAAYNTIANGGVYVAPKLVAATVDSSGQTHPTAPSAQHVVVSPTVAADMNTMLGEVVRVGTGQTAKVAGYTVAGKTGTALIALPNARGYQTGEYNSSFAGFVPAEHPDLTSIVVLGQTPLFGATAAAPVFSTIAGYGLRDFQIAPLPPKPPASGVPLATPETAQAAGEVVGPVRAAGGAKAATTPTLTTTPSAKATDKTRPGSTTTTTLPPSTASTPPRSVTTSPPATH